MLVITNTLLHSYARSNRGSQSNMDIKFFYEKGLRPVLTARVGQEGSVNFLLTGRQCRRSLLLVSEKGPASHKAR
ncbi:MAG: hypothetical protein A4E62_00856 [Syntrophorhabdus sp. PtaU1.Bin002]|nr:MAG: hypothetical protein A4E58_00393 [Syntrophorhabdus sp. PtaB.Bin006]OPY72450.1 MAG: hypothetical protein A4E62_00856 [Syntrophorhabdus sp. PtaU1.Bin002]